MRRLLPALLLAAACLVTGHTQAAGARPPLLLWAWERSEDLTFLKSRDVGVAFLAETIHLDGDTATHAPRRQPLRVDPSTYLVAVVRVETSHRQLPTFAPAQTTSILTAFTRAAALPGVRDVQIDFDAVASQRPAYRRLLGEIRRALPKTTGLSMTALASWCTFDRWLDEAPLPVDEVVPMVFAMGPEGPRIFKEIEIAGDFRATTCRTSVGIAAGGQTPKLTRPRRTWVFNAKPWDETTYLHLPSIGRPSIGGHP